MDPDSQPRRVRKGRRGLLGFLDDLRTRVKPTRGVLDLPLATFPHMEADTEDKRRIIAESDRRRHARPGRRSSAAAGALPGRGGSSVRPCGFQWPPAKNIVS